MGEVQQVQIHKKARPSWKRFHGNGKKNVGAGRGERASREVARQESVLRESKVLYIERRKGRRKRRGGRECGRKEKSGGRTNAAKKKKERNREREKEGKRDMR